MIYTYREPEALEGEGARFVRSAFFPLLVIVALIFAVASTLGSATWDDAEGLGSLVVFFVVVGVPGLLHERHSWCREIRLGDDGTCELETKRRVIRLHVNEIRSVEYRPTNEGDNEAYTIRYQGGKLHFSERMTEFRDFLARLQTLNPGVKLTGFPADAWPDLDIAATSAGRRIRGTVFPLIVVALLIYLASQALLGQVANRAVRRRVQLSFAEERDRR
jgi:hypothetical protein